MLHSTQFQQMLMKLKKDFSTVINVRNYAYSVRIHTVFIPIPELNRNDPSVEVKHQNNNVN